MSDATLARLSDLQSYDNSMNCMLFVGLTVVAHQAILLFTQYSCVRFQLSRPHGVSVSCLVISGTVQHCKDVLDYDLSSGLHNK